MNGQTEINNQQSGDTRKDALEAFNSFNGARNLLFWGLLLLPMLVIQGNFWVVHSGAIDPVIRSGPGTGEIIPAPLIVPPAEKDPPEKENPVDPNPSENQEEGSGPENQEEASESDPQETSETEPEISGGAPEQTQTVPRLIESLNSWIQISLKGSNYVLTFAAVIYCLALFFGMKLALIGQLGGLADASKAFFLALFGMVLIVPWQQVIAEGFPGTLFSYTELTEKYLHLQNSEVPKDHVYYYLRFVVLWGATLLFLICAQFRSCRAVQKIRQRLTTPMSVPEVPQDDLAESLGE